MPRPSDLAKRTILGFAQLIVALGVALFAPAWTLDFAQAWVYVFVFGAASAMITVYLWKNDPQLLERRVQAGPGAEKEKSQQLIQLFAGVAFIGILVVPSLDHRFAWSHVPIAVVVLGDILVAVGFFIVFLVFRENSFTGATIDVAADQRVVSTGPYALIRHPMYSGALVMLFGTPLALGSWWGLLAFIALSVAIVLRLLDEEQFLARSLPGYTEYCRKVRYRLVPFVW